MYVAIFLAFVHLQSFVFSSTTRSQRTVSTPGPAAIRWCMPTPCSVLTSKITSSHYEENVANKITEVKNNLLVDYTQCLQESETFYVNMTKLQFSEKMHEIYYKLRTPCTFETDIIAKLFSAYLYEGTKRYNRDEGFPEFGSYDLLTTILLKHEYPSNSKRTKKHRAPYWLEFGVNRAYSINVTSIIANKMLKQRLDIHGFDSFFGLPTEWEGQNMTRGAFSSGGVVPPTEKGIMIQKGLFNETLPGFLKDPKTSCSRKTGNSVLVGVNIDNDLYEGALYILNNLVPCMRKGTLLHFHDIFKPLKETELTKSASGLQTAMKLQYLNIMEELSALYDFLRTKGSGMILQLLPYKNSAREAIAFRVIRNPH